MSDDYRDPQLWPLLDALVRLDSAELTMAGLAGKVRTETGYPGAYRAIGRLVAAGYAEYSAPAIDGLSALRIVVRLTARGRSRWQLGRGWPRVVARTLAKGGAR